MTDFHNYIGFEKLLGVHLNDSKGIKKIIKVFFNDNFKKKVRKSWNTYYSIYIKKYKVVGDAGKIYMQE